MKFSDEQLREVLRRNATLAKLNPEVGRVLPRPQPQSSICHEPLAKKKAPTGNEARFRVCITSFRRRLCDPDNLCGKAYVDCCRHYGFIPDDNAAVMDYSIRQEKVLKKEDERTEIEITRIA